MQMTRIRQNELHQRRTRKKKLGLLRARYAHTTSSAEREKLLSKASRVAPQVLNELFLAPLKKK